VATLTYCTFTDFPTLSSKDTKRGLYKFRYLDWDRKPRQQFWTPNMVENDVNPGTYHSNELIHWTVRVIGRLAQYPRSKRMESAVSRIGQCTCAGTPHGRSWSIPLQPQHSYIVCEERTSSNPPNLERFLVDAWLNSELSFLCSTAGNGRYNPATFIPQVQSQIWADY
jgi:hypothetical protein